MFKHYLIVIFIVVFFEPLLSDQWLPAVPGSYTSKQDNFIAEIFNSNSRLKNVKPVCFFYKNNLIDLKKEDYNPLKRYNLIWKGELVNMSAPGGAFVSPNGYLLTLDDYAYLGSDHSLVLYGKDGALMQDYSLWDLIPQEDIDKIPATVSSIYWQNNARYFFGNPTARNKSWTNPSHFYILLESNKVIEIVLADGAKHYGHLSKYAYLDSLLQNKHINEEVQYRYTSLEYSSVTELLECLKK